MSAEAVHSRIAQARLSTVTTFCHMPINTSGPVTVGTRANLIEGLRSDPMPAQAVDAVLQQATKFTESVVQTYETSIASGEVGPNGTAAASDEAIIGPRPPAALLYGRVQSGKTAAMVLTSALALDNGFRIVVVLTADNVELVRQTANRFRDLDGPRVLSTLKEDDTAEWRAPEWEASEQEFLEEVADDGLVFVCAKNAFHLPQVLSFLQRIDAAAYPTIIFDDEADAATPDHTLQARSSGRVNAPAYASTIHRRVVENTRPGEEGQSTLELLPHSIYVQVTASPFVLFLQRRGSKIRPTLPFLLEPGPGYCGGERFFGTFDPDSDAAPSPPLVLVPDRENQALARRPVPIGLASSIEFALLSAAALVHSGRPWPHDGFKHLSHTSPLIDQHTLVAEHIERHLRTLRRELRRDSAGALARFSRAHAELARSSTQVPTLETLIPLLTSATRQAQVLRVNASAQRPPYGPRVNFMVGGNILGRGLTIYDLLVTYYLREAQVSQMDTVLQHARMYGYREHLMSHTRVYLPPQLATLFQEIHESEQTLRRILEREQAGEDVPVRIAAGSRATRPGALDTNALRVYQSGIAQVSPRYIVEDPETGAEIRELLAAADVPLNEDGRAKRSRPVQLELIRQVVRKLEPAPDDPGRWSVDAVLALIAAYEDQYAGTGIINVRRFKASPSLDRTRARLAGPEIDIIRDDAAGKPALALLYWETQEAPYIWYPALVLPRDMPTFIFGPS